jgi:hypothetical protein
MDWAKSAKQQSQDWTGRANEAYSAGLSATNWGKNWNLDRAAKGIGSVADINAYGKQIMPGVDEYITDKNARLNQDIADYNSKVPSSQQTMDKINASIDEQGNLIRQNRDYALNDIASTYDRANSYEGAANDAQNQAYKTALNDTELLKPGSQFQQAQVARSFAGSNAATAGALRRGGMDMNSPQAVAMMQRGTQAQARAMDDAAASGTQAYVSQKNALNLGQGQEAVRHAGALEGIDLNRSGRAIGTQNDAMDRTTAWEGAKQNAALTDKALSTQDWATNKGLTDELSNAQLEGIGLHQQQFNAGMGYNAADLAERNAGAQGVTDYGNNQQNYSLASSGQAKGWGDDSQQAYNTVYGREAANAGWGVKMLAGAAGGALNLVAPGAGSILTGAVNGAYGGGGGGGYGGGGYGGYGGTTPFLPQGGGGGWNPFSRQPGAYNTGGYSGSIPKPNYYSGTTTNPDGSLTVH